MHNNKMDQIVNHLNKLGYSERFVRKFLETGNLSQRAKDRLLKKRRELEMKEKISGWI